MEILEHSSGVNIAQFMITLFLFNGVGAATDALVNLFLLNNTHLTPMPFSIEILVVNIIYILGMLCGSLLKIPVIDRLNFKTIMGASIVLAMLLFVNFAFTANYWILTAMLFCTSFGMAKINPKITSEIMKMADDSIIGTVSGTMSSMSSISIPIGSIGLVLLYNAVSPVSAYYTAMALLFISLITLYIDKIKIFK